MRQWDNKLNLIYYYYVVLAVMTITIYIYSGTSMDFQAFSRKKKLAVPAKDAGEDGDFVQLRAVRERVKQILLNYSSGLNDFDLKKHTLLSRSITIFVIS